MKHPLKATIALVLFFFMAQIIGLLVVNQYIDHKKTNEAKEVIMKPLPYGLERPEVKNQSLSFVYITLAILAGTALVLLLVRFNKPLIWRFWFFGTMWLTLSIALAAFVSNIFASALAFIISLLKVFKPNIIIQNLSEVFVYGGLAAIFVPMLNLFAAFMLLIVISVYDFIAVFKTKHMIRLAEFQSSSKVFAGLFIPYEREKIKEGKMPIKMPITSGKGIDDNRKKAAAPIKSIAVLGGGDIGFTLLFAGVVMKELMLKEAILTGFLKALIIPIFATSALLILLLKGRQNKFYPAMPLLSLGCFAGYLIVLAV